MTEKHPDHYPDEAFLLPFCQDAFKTAYNWMDLFSNKHVAEIIQEILDHWPHGEKMSPMARKIAPCLMKVGFCVVEQARAKHLDKLDKTETEVRNERAGNLDKAEIGVRDENETGVEFHGG